MADATGIWPSSHESAVTEEMLMRDVRAMFSVKRLLDLRDQKHVIGHLQQQQQHQDQQHVADDTEVSQATDALASATHDDPLMLVGSPAGACINVTRVIRKYHRFA